MKGFTFYLEYASPQKKLENEHNGNVMAVYGGAFNYNLSLHTKSMRVKECITAIYYYPNSEVRRCKVSLRYLRRLCKLISEAEAREIHPNLFIYLDNMED